MSDTVTDEAIKKYMAWPAFEQFRMGRKYGTNSLNPWPSDLGLIEEFHRSRGEPIPTNVAKP